MSVLLATGLNEIEVKLENQEIQRCYHRSILLDVVKEVNPEIVVLSPHLGGEEDLLNSIIIPLRKSGIRIIFLPGTPNMPDVREWMKKLLPWGVYCYVFDPVTPEKITYRIQNPGRIIDLPESVMGFTEFPDNELPNVLVEDKKTFFERLKEYRLKHNKEPEKSAKKLYTEEVVKKRIQRSKKTGYIKDGVFITGDWKNPLDILSNNPDAVVIPASFGKERVKEYKRDIKARTVPLIVVGKLEGADLCVKNITPSVIEDVAALSKRMKELWDRADTDPLTNLYTRNFLKDWMEERELGKKQYSLALIDIDHFKVINDTYGHPTGDEILVSLTKFLKSGCRHSDIVARYGGEEFIICFPDTAVNQAHKLVERLRTDWIQKEIIIDNQIIKSTFSAGIAESGGDVINEADKLLYQAKNNGRNQVCSVKQDTNVSIHPVEIEFTLPVTQPHNSNARVIAVWNNDGFAKAEASLEIAKKNQAVLLEYDFVNPRLDVLMEVPTPEKEKCINKMPWEMGAGVLTFGDTLTVETALKLLYQYHEGINYLPAGNTLDSAVVIPVQTLIGLINKLDQVVIDLGTDIYSELTLAVLQRADIILVPSQNPSAYLKKQVNSLRAAGLKVEYYSLAKIPSLSRRFKLNV